MSTLQAVLDAYVPDPKIPLNFTSPYTLLIAVLLSAQCTDERVNEVTPALFAKADTPEKMVTLDQKEVEAIIKPCGLFRNKARAILALSKELIEHHHGQVPSSLEALEKLSGVGHKTASVVAVQAFNIPAFPVDTHIFRCARKWKLTESMTIAGVERDLKALIPQAFWGRVHLQIILFARRYCPARPDCRQECPACQKFILS